MSNFLSCECITRTTETPICIWRRIIAFLRCFRFRAAFRSPSNALPERTSALAGFCLSSRHIRSITKRASIVPHLMYEKCVSTMQKLQFQIQFLVIRKFSKITTIAQNEATKCRTPVFETRNCIIKCKLIRSQ